MLYLSKLNFQLGQIVSQTWPFYVHRAHFNENVLFNWFMFLFSHQLLCLLLCYQNLWCVWRPLTLNSDPDMIKRVCQNVVKRAKLLLEVKGGHLEQLLGKK